jgi:RimJ/RimL family protein N-acetyltransferase
MKIFLDNCVIRPLRLDDAESLARYANNRRVWRNVRNRFPHPYTLEDARQFVTTVRDDPQERVFTIEVDAQAVGSIGVCLKEGVERGNGEMGYWLGEPFWGRGLMTAAVRAFVPFARREYSLRRIEAWVYEWNPASARVLEKAGFTWECTLRRSAIKDGQVVDRWLYAYLAEENQPTGDRLSE